jgi:hypothetical protein
MCTPLMFCCRLTVSCATAETAERRRRSEIIALVGLVGVWSLNKVASELVPVRLDIVRMCTI